MENTGLFYGVNLGRLSEKKIDIDKLSISSGWVNAWRLDELARERGLGLFIGYGAGDAEYHRLSHVHIGIKVKNKRPLSSIESREAPRYNVDMIISLYNDSSELIAKLKEIGLGVEKRDLALYGMF